MIKEQVRQSMVYITSDGKEFKYKGDAQRHEEKISMPERSIPCKTVTLHTQDDFYNTFCYNIQNEDDFHYLEVKEWKYNYYGKFDGPGWYLAFRHDGGDYDDDYDIIKLDEYLAQLEEDVENLKDLTNS